ncbi:MAG: hypothetical protein OXU62_08580 [Gammaproteobacteria bacterium]|nr:hypothetical protein [Gammaproteobacteria bacterium]
MRLALPEFVGYIVMVVATIAVLGTILSGPITDWMLDREDRKEAEAKAKAAAAAKAAGGGGTAAGAAVSSTVAPAAKPA